MKSNPLFTKLLVLSAICLMQPGVWAQSDFEDIDASIDAILNPTELEEVAPAPKATPAPAATVAPKAAPAVKPAAKPAAPATKPAAPATKPATKPAATATKPVAKAPVTAPAKAVAQAKQTAAKVQAVRAEAEAGAEAVKPAPKPIAKPAASETAPAAMTAAASKEDSVTELVDDTCVTMSFEDVELPNVIKTFAEASDVTIISRMTNATPPKITANFVNKPWKQALISILSPYGLQMTEEQRGSGVYVIAEKSTNVPRYTQTFELKYLKADEVQKLFKSLLGDQQSLSVAFPSANAVVVKATEAQLAEFEKMLKVLDKPSRQVYIEARFVRLNASASKKLGVNWGMLENFGVNVDNLRGGFEINDGEVQSFRVKQSSAEHITSSSGSFDNNFQTGKGRMIGRGSSGSFSSRTSDGHTTMMPSELNPATKANLTAESLAWKKASGFGGQLSMSDLGLTLSAFEKLDGAQLFSNPRIIVENETTAKIDMTKKRPNINVDYQQSNQEGQRDNISTRLATIPGKKEPWVGEAFYSYGISVDVTPRISPTGLITVEIVPSISSIADEVVFPLGNTSVNYPIIDMQRLVTRFTMGDGKTAVIGGLTQTTENSVESGIPLLRHIPWIGPRLFGWKSRQKIQDEIIIFVTVGVVDGETIEEDVGMPKNAVLGRKILRGEMKEPGDRTDEEMFNLESKTKGYKIK